MTGLTNGTTYKFSVAARYGTVFSNESALSTAVAPEPAAGANAGADQSALRGRTVTLDGAASTKVVSYQWTQVRPAPVAPATYRDPVIAISDATAAKPTFRFPLEDVGGQRRRHVRVPVGHDARERGRDDLHPR